MGKHDTYWNGLEQYHADPEFQQSQKDEFQEDLSIVETLSDDELGASSNRRDFLKIFGFGLTAAALSACVDKPIKKAIPYVEKPEDVTPGVASWYASTCNGCASNCGVLVKSREGRPIKIEGNPMHEVAQGGTCPIGQGTVLSLYDHERIRKPKMGNDTVSWEKINTAIGGQLDGLKGSGGAVYVVSNTITSPTAHKVIEKFLAQFPNGKHVTYDPMSQYALAKVHSEGATRMQVPGYNFDKADVIVSFDADFLDTWLSPVEFTKDYVKGRKLDEKNPRMSKHIHFESHMSLTGTNADLRIPLKPSAMGAALVTLYNKIVGGGPSSGFEAPGNAIDRAARELKKADRGKSLVVCGSNDIAAQTLVKAINEALGNYGHTIDMFNPSMVAQGNDEAMMALAKNLGSAKAVFFLDDANPVYDYAGGADFATALGKVPLSVAFVTKETETSKNCKFTLAQNHFLESWGDGQARKLNYTMQQPLVRPLWDTKQWEEVLLNWSGESGKYYAFLQQNWQNEMFTMQQKYASFKDFWEKAVHDGVFNVMPLVDGAMAMPEDADADDAGDELLEEAAAPAGDAGDHAQALVSAYKKAGDGQELVIYQTGKMGHGRWANNPWLQEMPDPITKVAWDNYVSVPYKMAKDNGWKDGDKVTLSAGGNALAALPIIVQPGQANGTFAVQVGYGRGPMAGVVANGIGQNAFPLVGSNGTSFLYGLSGASVSATGENIRMAKSQTYINYQMQEEGGDANREWIEDRLDNHIVKETTLSEYKDHRTAGNKRPSPHHMVSLWDVHDKKGHHWAMAIDLNSCTGCGTCIVSCNAENNIAVVGRQEVMNRRDMHWMRLDRYFKGHPEAQDGSLQTVHQPMLCQHCDNAPCESVCPVLATVHSDEGINQMVYNRCVGTRYCANNCPYKVRRFNWFSYYWNDKFKDVNPSQHNKVGRLVLNPDVTVRARGVMEKCSFCVQRIQEKKLKAKVEMRPLKDGEIKTACQQSCPADAIVFGDLNDPKSEIHKLYFNKRGYHALEDVKTLPSVLYLTKVRNNDGKGGAPVASDGENGHG